MLIHPYRDRQLLATIPGTRILENSLDLLHVRIDDIYTPYRIWEIQGVFAPIPGRALGGVRVRLTDQKGFATFCNQRDLEVLLGVAAPGELCAWADTDYVGAADHNWCGFCMDDQDLLQTNEDIGRNFDRIEAALDACPSAVLLVETLVKDIETAFAVPFVWLSLLRIPETTELLGLLDLARILTSF